MSDVTTQNEIITLAREQKDYAIELRRDFHQHPEVSLQEHRTAGRIEEELDKWGIPHQRIGETGVYGSIKGTQAGNKCIALRADIDALAIQETNDVPYRSKEDGRMHACGHDAHTACLLGAARILQEKKDSFGGEIRLCFQQGEEIGAGATQFIEADVLKGVGRVFGLHTAPDINTGVVGVKKGVNNASVDHFQITIEGKAAHVSTPQKGIDALYIAAQIVVLIQAIVTRRTSPIDPLLIGIGKLNAGTAYNIIAQDAVIEGTVRATSQETRARVKQEITDLVTATARIYGGEGSVIWTDFTSPLINHDLPCDEVATLAKRLWGEESVETGRALSLGGDDIAEFLLEAEGVYAYLGTRNEQIPATLVPAHNGGFDIDEDALEQGVVLYAAYALEYLG